MSKIGKLVNNVIPTPSAGFWKVRLITTIGLLLLALIGLIITYATNVESAISLYVWLIIGGLYAIIAIGLALYLHRNNHGNYAAGVWGEILHWVAFIIILFILHVYVHTGMVGRFEGGLFILAVLAFSVLVSGIYLDATFLIVGVALVIFCLIMSILTKYLAILVVIVVVLIAATIAFFVAKRKSAANEEIALKETQTQKQQKQKSAATTTKSETSKDDDDQKKE